MTQISIITKDSAFLERVLSTFEQVDIDVVFSAGNLCAFYMSLNAKGDPEILLLDLQIIEKMKDLDKVKILLPKTKIIIASDSDQKRITQKVLKKGIDGFILKDACLHYLVEAIKEIGNGNAFIAPQVTRTILEYLEGNLNFARAFQLTEIETGIVEYLIEGLSYKMIGESLQISIDSVRYHIKNIYKKMRINSKIELIQKAGII